MDRRLETLINHIDNGLPVIPVRAVFDKKKEVYTGKIPAIRGWQKYCDIMPDMDDIDEWNLNKTTGIGMCVGPSAGLMAVDIDEKDEAIRDRLRNALPHTPLAIKGDPQKGGKFIFKTPDNFRGKEIHTIKNSLGQASVEFFFNRKQVVLPPSMHTMDENMKCLIRYEWMDHKLAEFAMQNIDDIPEFNMAYIAKAEEIIKGTSPMQAIDDNSPIVQKGNPTKEESCGRFQDMGKYISRLFTNKVPITLMANMLKEHDLDRNKDNLFFLDKTKGFGDEYDLNIMTYIIGHARTFKEKLVLDVKTSDEIDNPWEDMILDKDVDIKDIDLNMIPPSARQFCESCHEMNNITYFGAYVILLTALSPLVGNKRMIRPKIKDTFYLHPNLYTVLCQPSGTRKTETLSRAMKFLNDIQKRHDINLEPVIKAHERKKEANEYFIKEKKKLHKENLNEILGLGEALAPKHLMEENDQLLNEIENLEKEIEPIKRKQFVVNGATYERTLQILEETKTGNLVYFEEQQEMLNAQSQKGNEKLRQLILDGREGKQSKLNQTKTQGDIVLDKVTLSLLTATQPKLLAYHLRKEDTIAQGADGYFARNMYIFTDYCNKPETDTPYDHNSMHKTKRIFDLAYEIEESDNPVMLESMDKWLQYHTEINKKTITSSEQLKPMLQKMPNFVLAMSYLDSLFRQESDVQVINDESLEVAQRLFECMFSHVSAVLEYGVMEEIDEFITLVQEGTISEGDSQSVLKNHIWRLKDSKNRANFMDELQRRKIIRIKSNKIQLNPKIYGANLKDGGNPF